MPEIMIISLNSFFGGGEVFVEKLSSLLLSLKYKVHVITTCKEVFERINKLKIDNMNISVYFIQKNRFSALPDIYQLYSSIQPKIVILNGQFEAHYSFLFHRSKIIFVRHTSLKMTSKVKRLIYLIESLLFADRIILVNDFMKNEYPSVLHNKISIVYNWTDQSLIKNKEINRNKDKICILYCGRLDKAKNVDIIIKACIGVENVNLIIVGDGPERHHLEKLARDNYATNIQFVGFLPHDDVYKFYEICDIFISMSMYEAFPLAVLEAFQHGLACILSDIPAHRDVSKNGEAALLCDVSVDKLKENILKLTKDFNLRSKLSNNAKLRVIDFSFELAREKWRTIIESLV